MQRHDVLIKEIQDPVKSRAFFKLPYLIYKDIPLWVPPLIMEQKKLLNRRKNPFFKKGILNTWLAFRERQVVGRIIAFINPAYNDYHGQNAGFLGFFECINDQEVANRLFNESSKWLLKHGVEKVIGPVNLDTGNECGVLIQGFDSMPSILMNFTPHYYPTLFEKAGFIKEHDLLAFMLYTSEVANQESIMQKMKRIGEGILKREGVTFRTLNLSDFKNEVVRIADLYNELLAENWGFCPVSREEVMFTAGSMRSIVKPAIVSFLEKDGQTIGCSFSMPNINEVFIHMNGKLFPFGFLKFLRLKNKIEYSRVILLGVRPEFQFQGFAILMIYRTIFDSIRAGFKGAELSWISEDNHNLIKIFHKIGAVQTKTYRVFSKPL